MYVAIIMTNTCSWGVGGWVDGSGGGGGGGGAQKKKDWFFYNLWGFKFLLEGGYKPRP